MKPVNAFPCILLFAIPFFLQPLYGQWNISVANTAVSENFDALPSTGNSLPATGSIFAQGWTFLESGSNANLTYSAGTGSDNTGNTYSYGVAGQKPVSDRAFGFLQSVTLSSIIGVIITNNTGQTISSVTVGFTGEVWRLSATVDSLLFSYQAGNVALNAPTGWTPVAGLTWRTPATGAGAVDGNLPGNRVVMIPVTITGFYLSPGATLTLRWSDVSNTSSAGMGIDDVSVTLWSAFNGYFRSKSSGNWNSLNSWETSPDQLSWAPATTGVPTDKSAGIFILDGHAITVSSNLIAGKITVHPGGKLLWLSGNFTLTDGPGDDLHLQGTNSEWDVAGSITPQLNGTATVRVGNGARLRLTGNSYLLNFHTSAFMYGNGSWFEYSYNAAPAINGMLFSAQDVDAVPIFQYNSPYSAALGTVDATTVNGRVEIAAGRTLNLNNVTGSLTFRDGLTGDGHLSASSTVRIRGANAVLSGNGNINAHLLVEPGSTTSLLSNKSMSAGKTLTVEGIVDLGAWQIKGVGGTANVVNGGTGTLKTSNAAGLVGAAASFPPTSVSVTFAAGSTVIYTANGNQVITTGADLPYQKLILSGSGVKSTQGGGNLVVQNSCVVNSGTMLTLTGSAADQVYLNNNAILQIRPGGAFDNGGESAITTSAGVPTIIVGGTFITRDQQGFTGPGSAIPSILPVLESGCTIEYGRMGDQLVQATHLYENLTFSSSGNKTPTSALYLKGTISILGNAILNGSDHTIGGVNNNLVMTGSSRLIIGGTGTQPALGGLYQLSPGTTIEFSNSNVTTSTIRQGSPLILYNHVEISGSNVSVPLSGILLQNDARLTVKAGGVLKITSPNGLYGPSGAAILSTYVPVVDLQTGSTVEYNGADQSITTAFAYSQLILSGSGEKKATNPFVVNQTLTRSGNASLSGVSPLYGTNAMLRYADATAARIYSAGLEWPAANGPKHIVVNLSGSGGPFVRLTNYREISGNLTLSAGSLQLNNFDLAVGGNISGAGTFTGSELSSLTLSGGSSTIRFTQTTDEASNALRNLIVTGGIITLESKLQLYASLDIAGGILDLNDQPLVLKSTATQTARVAERKGQLLGASQVTVERYLSSAYKRRWRLLTAPIMGANVNAAWQEGRTWNGSVVDGATPGYGTLITGHAQGSALAANAKGFDFWSSIANAQASIRKYQGNVTHTLASWQPLSSTFTANFNNGEAYLLFIRGDRSVTTGSGGTVLRTKGQLKEAAEYSVPILPMQSHTLVGNPFASPLHFNKLYADNKSVIKPYYWIWQASLSSTGGYALVKPEWEGSSTYEIIPSGILSGQSADPIISSGEGFFVMPASPLSGTNLLIRQAHKSSQVSSISVLREPETKPAKLYMNLHGGNNDTAILLDGVLLQLETSGPTAKSSVIGKAINNSENLSFFHEGSDQQVLFEPIPVSERQLILRVRNLLMRNYQLQIHSRDFAIQGLTTWLVDRYVNKEIPISLGTSLTTYDFDVNNEPASQDPLRFHLLFRPAVTISLPLSKIAIKAQQHQAGVMIKWSVIDESVIRTYELQKAFSIHDFSAEKKIYTTLVTGRQPYVYFDSNPATNNYYRLKVISVTGLVSYSDIVKVEFPWIGKNFIVFPNPIVGGKFNLQLVNQPAGIYRLSLRSNYDQIVHIQSITHEGGTNTKPISIPGNLSAGEYILKIENKQGVKTIVPLFIAN